MGMDSELIRLMAEDTLKLNPLLANGLAVEHMKRVEAHVDKVFRSTAKGYPEGFTYRGYTQCTPQEEYNEITRKRVKRLYDVAESQIYYVKYLFDYKGTPIIRYLALPFVGMGGTITLGGSRFNISPVISDRVISVGVTNIFVRLLRDRLIFERTPHHFRVNGVRDQAQVVHATIYHRNAKMKKIKPTVKAECALTHYLMCKYGFYETFRKFGNCRPVVGGLEITDKTHPPEEWAVCSTVYGSGAGPKGFGRSYYAHSTLKVAIRHSEFTPMVKALVGGLFYAVDHFPTRCKAEYIDSTHLWKTLMGHIIWSGDIGEGRLVLDVDKHLASLDEYIDLMSAGELRDIGTPVQDLYELFGIIIEQFSDWLLGAANKISSMYDKQLNILYYVLYEITSEAVKMMFRLKAASEKDSAVTLGLKKEMSLKEVIATMNSTLRTGLIYSITQGHSEVSNISSSGDNLAFKITANLVPQSSSSRLSSKKAKVMLNDPTKRLHVSVSEHCGYSFLPKSEPSGRSRVNHHSALDHNAVLQRNPDRVEMLDDTQKKIDR